MSGRNFNSLRNSRRSEQKTGERRSTPGVRKQATGEVGEGLARRRAGWGEKESPAVNPKHFTELRSPTNGDWLTGCSGARQSKYDIRNLSFMHNLICGTQQGQNGRVRKSVGRGLRILC